MSINVSAFEKVQAQLQGLFDEVGTLSKKKPDDAINKFKLKFINPILAEANKLLTGDYKPFSDFEQFDEDSLPTNSDTVLILSQYLNCLEKLRADNIKPYSAYWFWMENGNKTDIRTAPPKKITW
ncbi:hypothetical protein QYF52_25490 [Paenibacillus polymyxa]|uniref:hypothetical protein n=1 Tax=Paenibacillus polymyxa TaxID=1406 RepID=UPI000FAF0C6E|nr:hypothetical protein [Paenibacillus polymyxa]MDN4081282.1 hypothetical protein [Paenibacillus polymyxa]MDN4106985.1 hypothetical protein [Paenibacillus polymyxa]MDN4116929.1 hypothetical protein [Paenibacillus polymyxa]